MLVGFVLCGMSLTLEAAQIASANWSGAANNQVRDKNGTLLPVGDLVLIGSFDISISTIKSNPSPSVLNSHFTQYGYSRIGTGVNNTPGAWSDTTTASTGTAGNIAGNRVYIIVTNSITSSFLDATQEAIFSLSSDNTHSAPASNWKFPFDTDTPNTITLDISNLTDPNTTPNPNAALLPNADLVVGSFNTALTDFQLVAVPEPSSMVLALISIGVVGVVSRRSRRAKN